MCKQISQIVSKTNIYFQGDENLSLSTIDSSDIRMKVQCSNWEDALRVTAQPLVEEQKITDDYVQAMIDSVHNLGPYIVIAPGLALGHARPSKAVKQSCMSIASLANPVKFGNKDNDPVDLVIVIASINDTDHLGLMKKIVTFLNEADNLKWLRSASQDESTAIADAINNEGD